MAEQLPVICVMGATASGKTDFACQLYDQGGYELISVDSALIYRGMDIGTAKPTQDELARYPHALIDILEPYETYSAAQFLEDATVLINKAHRAGKTPILVGGTTMYFNLLLNGMADMPSANEAVRLQITQEAALKGWEAIHQELAQVDPRAAARFKPSDRQRLLRALEVYRMTGQAISDFHDLPTKKLPFDFKLAALIPERDILHQRIALRLEKMWQNGFVEEVQGLLKDSRNHIDLPSMRSVGYRQVIEYLQTPDHLKNMQDMKDKALFATRQLAKRQGTWLRKIAATHPMQHY